MITVYPVYRFRGYFKRQHIYYALTIDEAENFALSYNRSPPNDNPNGCYIGTRVQRTAGVIEATNAEMSHVPISKTSHK